MLHVALTNVYRKAFPLFIFYLLSFSAYFTLFLIPFILQFHSDYT